MKRMLGQSPMYSSSHSYSSIIPLTRCSLIKSVRRDGLSRYKAQWVTVLIQQVSPSILSLKNTPLRLRLRRLLPKIQLPIRHKLQQALQTPQLTRVQLHQPTPRQPVQQLKVLQPQLTPKPSRHQLLLWKLMVQKLPQVMGLWLREKLPKSLLYRLRYKLWQRTVRWYWGFWEYPMSTVMSSYLWLTNRISKLWRLLSNTLRLKIPLTIHQ